MIFVQALKLLSVHNISSTNTEDYIHIWIISIQYIISRGGKDVCNKCRLWMQLILFRDREKKIRNRRNKNNMPVWNTENCFFNCGLTLSLTKTISLYSESFQNIWHDPFWCKYTTFWVMYDWLCTLYYLALFILNKFTL